MSIRDRIENNVPTNFLSRMIFPKLFKDAFKIEKDTEYVSRSGKDIGLLPRRGALLVSTSTCIPLSLRAEIVTPRTVVNGITKESTLPP